MFEVREEAAEKIKQFLEGRKGIQSIRILMTEGGWKGPYLVMALDEQKDNSDHSIGMNILMLEHRDRAGNISRASLYFALEILF